MNIQATIKHLQSNIKRRSKVIANYEHKASHFKYLAKEYKEKDHWRAFRSFKCAANTLAKQQKIEKDLYKLMLNITKNSPNGSISLYQIRANCVDFI